MVQHDLDVFLEVVNNSWIRVELLNVLSGRGVDAPPAEEGKFATMVVIIVILMLGYKVNIISNSWEERLRQVS